MESYGEKGSVGFERNVLPKESIPPKMERKCVLTSKLHLACCQIVTSMIWELNTEDVFIVWHYLGI